MHGMQAQDFLTKFDSTDFNSSEFVEGHTHDEHNGIVKMEFLTNDDNTYKGVRIYDALGGPTCYIDTSTGTETAAWAMRKAEQPIPEHIINELDEYWEDAYYCIHPEHDPEKLPEPINPNQLILQFA